MWRPCGRAKGRGRADGRAVAGGTRRMCRAARCSAVQCLPWCLSSRCRLCPAALTGKTDSQSALAGNMQQIRAGTECYDARKTHGRAACTRKPGQPTAHSRRPTPHSQSAAVMRAFHGSSAPVPSSRKQMYAASMPAKAGQRSAAAAAGALAARPAPALGPGLPAGSGRNPQEYIRCLTAGGSRPGRQPGRL